MSADLAAALADFLAYKRALGRKYLTEEATLHLLVGFAEQHEVTDLAELTPRLLDEFVASRPRERSRSFNHLTGVTGSFLDWARAQQRLDQHFIGVESTAARRTADCLSCLTPPRPVSCSKPQLPFLITPGPPAVARPTTPSLPCATVSDSESGRPATCIWRILIPPGSS